MDTKDIPPVKAEARSKAAPRKRARKAATPLSSGGRRVWLRRIGIALAVLALTPVVLTMLYAVPVVHPVSTLMVADLATFRGYDRRWVSMEEIAPVMAHSVIMSEDGQFCRHSGIDWGALNEVVSDALEGEGVRGASTIPMQSVKNLYLWSSRSYVRKVLEAPYALVYDLILSKRRIMEIYLNIVELGPNIYGVEAAAQHHFGRSAAKLTARQAALLTAALPNPALRNPSKPSPGMNRIAQLIQRRAARAGSYVDCMKG